MRTLLIASALLLATTAHADWTLTSPSELTLVSTKNVNIAEVHRFDRLQGSINANGEATLNIDLTSIDSRIEIRDQRMRDFLFETNTYARATLTTSIAPDVFKKAAKGEIQTIELTGKLHIRGKEADVTTPVLVVPAAKGQLVVTSLKPVLIYAEQFGLASGIQQLRDIAKLQTISETVPVSFTLTFSQK